MKLNKKLLFSSAVIAGLLLSVAPATVQAADTTITKTIMHTSMAYDKDGKSTGTKYYAYKTVDVMTKPVKNKW
ncbi:hypothetical protein LHEJCM20397_10960 [Lactobacillus helveticus]|nr:Bacterial surface layer protein [Lactobacillus helveticus]GFP08228.1 hypothetical protein LHEJCM1006_03740 [Lactobacillus helveticus]GFP17548.1 hypothetical protein LHEJCM20397_10960 [Lactobacillus helveticus]